MNYTPPPVSGTQPKTNAQSEVTTSGKTGFPIAGNAPADKGVFTRADDEPGLVRLGDSKLNDTVKKSDTATGGIQKSADVVPQPDAGVKKNITVSQRPAELPTPGLSGVSSGVGSPLAMDRKKATVIEEQGESRTRITSAATAASMHSLERSPEVQTIRQSIQEQHDLQFREIQDLRSQSDTYMKRALSAEDQLLIKATEIEALRRQLDAMVLERDTKWKKLEGDYDSLVVERGNLVRDAEQLNQRIIDLEELNGNFKRDNESLNRQVVSLRTERDTIYAKFLSIQTSAKKVHFGMQHVREGLDELQGPANEVITIGEKTTAFAGEQQNVRAADTGAGVGGNLVKEQTTTAKSGSVEQQASAFKTGITQPSSLTPGITQSGHSLSQSNISVPQQTATPSFGAGNTLDRGFAVSPSGTPIFHLPETTGTAARQGSVGAR
jgi:hypothetical protein